MRDFRFSFNIFGITSREAFVAECREAEEYGYDTVFAADHLGIPAPFPLLVTAAEATQRLRVGTLVLNAAFWNAALLAREVATADILTDGRLELGLGSGHMKWEFDEAGIRPVRAAAGPARRVRRSRAAAARRRDRGRRAPDCCAARADRRPGRRLSGQGPAARHVPARYRVGGGRADGVCEELCRGPGREHRVARARAGSHRHLRPARRRR